MVKLLSVMVVVVACAARVASAGGQEVVQEPKFGLHSVYENNAVAADKNYTGKVVELKAVRGVIEKDKNGRYYVKAILDDLPALICYLGKSSLELAAKAQPKDVFNLRGKCLGRIDTKGAHRGFVVTLEECELLGLLEYRDGQWRPVKR